MTGLSHNTELLLITFGAVVGLIVLVTRFKLNAFIALVVASLFVGLCSGMKLTDIAKGFQEGVGNTLGFIAVIVGLGTMLGRMLAESGGAEVVARTFIGVFGESRIHWALACIAFVVGLPVFFGVGMVLLIPIIFTIAREGRSSLIWLGMPMVAGLSVSHGLIPPHPGPLVAIDKLGADMGRTILYGILVGLPTALLAGPVIGCRLARFAPVEPGGVGAQVGSRTVRSAVPGFGVTLFTILLPVIAMMAATLADVSLPPEDPVKVWATFLGSPLVAMLLAVLLSFYTFGKRCGFNRGQILKFTEDCVGPAASIMLVVGAGGGFSRILVLSGVDKSIAQFADGLAVSPLLLGWVVASLIRIAVGSATVAITLAATIIAPIAAATPGTNKELLVLALGAGSLIASHVNDGGFWFVKEYLNMSVGQTLKTWTVLETVIAVVALVLLMAMDVFL